jgi:cell division protein FtsL
MSMKKFIDAIGAKLTAETVKTIDANLKRFTPAEKMLIVGLAMVGLSVISASREEQKGGDGSKKTK